MLQNCRRVMNEGDTLFVVEGFVGHRLFGWDGYRRWCDVYQMMCLFGKERTLDEMHDLLSQAGFERMRREVRQRLESEIRRLAG